jgi:hypothetical protein
VSNIPYEAIATRELEFVGADGKRASVSVTLGKPVRASQDWSCSYRVAVFDQTVERAIVGVDSMQALILALHVLPAELQLSNSSKAGGLWMGRTLGSVGPARRFSVPDHQPDTAIRCVSGFLALLSSLL